MAHEFTSFGDMNSLIRDFKEGMRLQEQAKKKAKQKAKEKPKEVVVPPPPPPPAKPAEEVKIQLEGEFFLYPHQIQAIQFVVQRETQPLGGVQGGILSLEMGLGKTLVAIVLAAITANIATTATLYVCNKSLVSIVYKDVVKFFGKRMRVLLFHHELLGENFFNFCSETPRRNHLIVITYDTVIKLAQAADLLPKSKFRGKDKARWASIGNIIFNTPWFRIVADESQRFANPKSNIYQAMMAFPRGRRLCLTGTPIRNYEEDLFSQLRFCGLTVIDKLRNWSIQNFQKFHLEHTILHMSVEDAKLDLPPKKQETITLELNELEKKLYLWFLDSANQTLQLFKKKIPPTTFGTVLEKFIRLRQICISPHLLCPESKQRLNTYDKARLQLGSILGETNVQIEQHLRNPQSALGIHSTKLQGVVKLTQKIPKEDKILVFSQWSSAAQLACAALQQVYPPESILFLDGQSKHRDQIFVQFQTTPSIRCLCMTMVGALGLTLIEANHVILLEPHWNETNNEQAAARVWRIGQTKPVTIWQVIMKDSIEQKMLEICQTKHDLKDVFLKQGVSLEVLQQILGVALQ